MSIYPNPAVSEITISGVEVEQVIIADMTSKIVLRVATEKVDTEDRKRLKFVKFL